LRDRTIATLLDNLSSLSSLAAVGKPSMSTHTNGRAAVWIDHLARDVRHAARMIARMPGLATVVILSLGIGIGVNTAIFSWIQGLVFKPIPGVRDAASFHLIEPRNESGSYTSA
jgi:hypothetical protein